MNKFKNRFFAAFMLLAAFALAFAFANTALCKDEDDFLEEAKEEVRRLTEILEEDDYEVRDIFTYGMLENGEVSVVEQQFYSGNSYVIIASGDSRVKDVDIAVSDEDGNLMAIDEEEAKNAQVEFVPEYSGTYFIMVKNYDCSPHDKAWIVLTYGYK